MQRRAFMQSVLAIPLTGLIMPVWSGEPDEDVAPMPFGFGGGKKMLYDCRQRSQAVYLNENVYIGFKGAGVVSDSGKVRTRTMLIRYDPGSRQFSKPVTFGKPSVTIITARSSGRMRQTTCMSSTDAIRHRGRT